MGLANALLAHLVLTLNLLCLPPYTDLLLLIFYNLFSILQRVYVGQCDECEPPLTLIDNALEIIELGGAGVYLRHIICLTIFVIESFSNVFISVIIVISNA